MTKFYRWNLNWYFTFCQPLYYKWQACNVWHASKYDHHPIISLSNTLPNYPMVIKEYFHCFYSFAINIHHAPLSNLYCSTIHTYWKNNPSYFRKPLLSKFCYLWPTLLCTKLVKPVCSFKQAVKWAASHLLPRLTGERSC